MRIGRSSSRRGRSRWSRSAPRPPTSWCGGRRVQPPRRTRRSGRSSRPSSRRAASRSSLSSLKESCGQARGRARGRAATPRLRLPVVDIPHPTNDGPTRVGSSTSRTRRPFLGPVRPGCARSVTLLDATTGQRGLYLLPMGLRPTTSTSGRACSSARASRSRTSRRSGMPSGPSGATRSSRRCARRSAATTSGASASDVGRGSIRENGFWQFVTPTRPTT